MAVFRMPSLGSDMEKGTLIEWLVAPGDAVSRGDVVAVVETQKGAIEIESFEEGVVERLDAQLGATLPVGTPMAVIRREGEAAAPKAETAAVQPVTAPGAPAQGIPPAEAGASPAARARAAEIGLDLATLAGSGPGGAVVLADVVQAKADGAPEPLRRPGRQGLDLDVMRGAIAAAMTRSKHEIPHYYLEHETDLDAAETWLRTRNADREPAGRLLMGALFVKAAALAAAKVAGMNGQYENGAFRKAGTVNAGIAVALRGGGLIAPAIMGAETLSLAALMEAMRDLVQRARAGRLKGSEMTQGTITVSSLGESGVDGMTGVIYPPQVALVAFGTPRLAPRVVDGAVTARHCVHVTLAADHRVSDARRGAKLLREIDTFLQTPEAL